MEEWTRLRHAAHTVPPPLAVITQDHAAERPQVSRGPAIPPKTSYVNRYGDPLGLKSNTWVALLSPVEDRPTSSCGPTAW